MAIAPAVDPPPGVRLGLRPALGVIAIALLAHLLGIGFGPLDGFLSRWSFLVLELGGATACALRAIHVREERRAWTLLAIALFSWATGDAILRIAYYSVESPPIPSLADAFWLAFYPFAYAGIVVLLRDRARNVSSAVWLDGLIASLAVGAFVSALVLRQVLEQIGGTALSTEVNLTYVLADAVLLALVMVAFAVTGWRLDRAWAWLGGALALFAFSDSAYLYEVGRGIYVTGGALDAGWAVALLLVGIAAWHTAPPRVAVVRGETWRSIALPIAFGFAALAIEAYDHFTQVMVLALIFATACLAAVLARLAITFAQYMRMLQDSREQATTDALTGLGNRRQLMSDLREALQAPPWDGEWLLLLLDLDHFKTYNDTLGHPAGDALLERLGEKLERDLQPWGRAYRMGGDEFCALLRIDGHSPERLAAIAGEALGEPDAPVSISSSAGWAVLPNEAADSSSALRLADRRMYAAKGAVDRSDRRNGLRPIKSDLLTT